MVIFRSKLPKYHCLNIKINNYYSGLPNSHHTSLATATGSGMNVELKVVQWDSILGLLLELRALLGAGVTDLVVLQPGILDERTVFTREEPTLTDDEADTEGSRDGII